MQQQSLPRLTSLTSLSGAYPLLPGTAGSSCLKKPKGFPVCLLCVCWSQHNVCHVHSTRAPVSACPIAQSMWGFISPYKSCIFSISVRPTDECAQSHPLLAPHCLPERALLLSSPIAAGSILHHHRLFWFFHPSLSLSFCCWQCGCQPGQSFSVWKASECQGGAGGWANRSGICSWLAGLTLRQNRPVAAKGSGHFLEFGKRKADWIHTAEHSFSTGGWPWGFIFNLYCGLFHNGSLLDL